MGGLFSGMFDIDIRPMDIGMKVEIDSTPDALAQLIRDYRGRVCVITGAGISATQLPTFRSKDNSGLWDVLAAPILSKSQFYQNPLPAWRIVANVRNLQADGKIHHTLSHNFLHKLIEDGYVYKILTQNCDSLHTYDDDTDECIVELHGAINDYGDCEKCHQPKPIDKLQILNKDKCPVCPVCGSILKPPIAFFEDVIPRNIREVAYKALQKADVLIVIGTYCAVDPVLSMVECARRNGTILVEINPEPSNGTTQMHAVLRGTSDDILRKVAEEIYPGRSFD